MEFNLAIERVNGKAFYKAIADAIAEAIESGQLLPGQQLPPARVLATHYQTSSSTAVRAYESLISMGYLETSPKEGTYVSYAFLSQDSQNQIGQVENTSVLSPNKVSPFGKRLLQGNMDNIKHGTVSIDFPSADLLPLGIWHQYISRAKNCYLSDPSFLNYSANEFGSIKLREAIADYLVRAKGIKCSASQIIITASMRLDIACRALITPGDLAIVENPGYPVLRRVLQSHGAELVAGRVDDNGLVVEELELLANIKHGLKLICVSPTHQDPTGVSLSLSRRKKLLDLAEQTDSFIWEADFDCQFRYASSPLPSLKGLDNYDRVIYSSAFWMSMGPMARLGFLVLPKQMIHIFELMMDVTGNDLSVLEQSALHDFIVDGQWERVIHKTRALYARKRQILIQSLLQLFGRLVSMPSESSAVHLLIQLDLNVNAEVVLDAAKECGMTFKSTSNYYLSGAPKLEFMVQFANLNDSEIFDRVKSLAHKLIII
jgi:GntR family transcriptional regulator/MocR family aminotransferase